jgi:hypothetical protein
VQLIVISVLRMEWANIQYCDFYDVPRIFVFEVRGRRLLADCPFDHKLDEYSSVYKLFELPSGYEPSQGQSWAGLREHAARVLGEVEVADVIFDVTKRRQVQLRVFGKVFQAFNFPD